MQAEESEQSMSFQTAGNQTSKWNRKPKRLKR